MKNLKDIVYVGVDDTELDLFEGQYKVPEGMSYNSYMVLDDKIAVMDAVDRSGIAQWLGNVDAALCGREPDYLVISHMEPDHSAGIAAFAAKYPSVTVVGNAKMFEMFRNFYGLRPSEQAGRKRGRYARFGRTRTYFRFRAHGALA